ncbi:OmpA family protein [Flavobacterium kingsejongi]|uniref:OmpA-like domain-containing protein n=1 Tax=Flavobacterium kingsejongi TaxID=1678728 RepID=A0A2S1LQV2_9FLAO|nr:OmpA family protein [Flavobacterium kingsejongi]AWG26042.1 hypothetical protein FK004_12815 [Flavobacterium kingsejongi]
MAKGVKKIYCAEGVTYPRMSIPNKKVVIVPEQWVFFKVSEWEADTTEADKKKNLVWMRRNNNRKIIINQLTVGSDGKYGFWIPKLLCGSYTYYIEASMSGKRDSRLSGLYVSGWCEAKIASSKWRKQPNSTSIKNNKKADFISYGENVYLNLGTEGLNGDLLIVEILNRQTAKDDKLIHVYTNVEVIDGQVNLKIENTFSWMSHVNNIQNVEEFYIKVKNQANGRYIKDSRGDELHAIYLNVKNKVASSQVAVAKNQTPAKVGKPDEKRTNIHTCTFDEIGVEDTDYFEVFKQGKTSLKKKESLSRLVNFEIFFDFDKDTIREDAKPVLQNILNFLLFNNHLDMLLSGHADERGSLDYNQALSERRANTTREFFISKGLDPDKIRTRAFGEATPKDNGKTEASYQKNRRTEIQFSYLEYNADALVYETIASSVKKGKKIKVKIKSRSDEGCFRDDKHKKNEVLVSNLGVETVKKTGNEIPLDVYSNTGNHFPKNYFGKLVEYLNPFSTLYNSFSFYINSCAYFSDKNKSTLEVRVYPDIIWIAHFQYNYKESGNYFFHNKKVELKTGIADIIDEFTNSLFFKITKILPSQWIMEYVVLEYIKSQAEDYSYGAHVIYDRTLEKPGKELLLQGTEVNLITQTSYTKYAAASVIYCLVLVGIAIDLLMIYLTRGRNLTGRIARIAKKVKQVQSVIKKMEDAGIEIVPPAIAINGGIYYYKQANGKMAEVFEANLKAKPLVAVNFKKDFDLLEMLHKKNDVKGAKLPDDKKTKEKLKRNSENNSKIADAFEGEGKTSITGSITVIGEIAFEHNVKFNFLTQSYSIIDILGNGIQTAKDERLITEQISFEANIDGKFEKEFKFDPLQTKIEGKMNIKLKGAAGVKLKYGVNEKQGLFITQTVYFSGIEGTYLGSLKAKSRWGLIDVAYETNKGKPMPFTLMEPFEVEMYTVQLFNQPKNKKE